MPSFITTGAGRRATLLLLVIAMILLPTVFGAVAQASINAGVRHGPDSGNSRFDAHGVKVSSTRGRTHEPGYGARAPGYHAPYRRPAVRQFHVRRGMGPHGVAVHSREPLALVANEDGDAVSLLSLPEAEVIGEAATGRYPAAIAVDAARDLAVVVLSKEGRVALLSLPSLETAVLLDVGRDPGSVAIDGEAGIAVVANAGDDSLSLVSLDQRRRFSTCRNVGRTPRGIALQPGTGRAWVALEKEDALAVVDLANCRVAARIPVGRHPGGVAYSADHHRVAVANAMDGSVSLLDSDSGVLLATVPVGSKPRGLAFDDAAAQLLVANEGSATLSFISLAGAELVETLELPAAPRGIAVDERDRLALVTTREDGLTVIDLADVVPPVITVGFPPGGHLTNQSALTVSGSLDEGAELLIGGVPVALDVYLHFLHGLTLSEGDNAIELRAVDEQGNASELTLQVRLDTQAPSAPDAVLIEARAADSGVALGGAAGSAEALGLVTVMNARSGESAGIVADANGAFSLVVAGFMGDVFRIAVEDAAGNRGPSIDFPTVDPTVDDGLPPDPAGMAPPLPGDAVTSLAAATEFLYRGANPVQSGMAEDAIEDRRVAVLRGMVSGRAGEPLAGVAVSVHGHPELGQTASRADGRFDLAVNGGGRVTLDYVKEGYLPLQRAIDAPWQDYAWLPDAVMTALDTEVTAVRFGAAVSAQLARGGRISDGSGFRQATLVFPAGIGAQLVMPDGEVRAVENLGVRATEYSVGEQGPRAMPGELPPTSGYTYAVELSADEAIASGARQVRFDRPLHVYVENFLGFPVGGVVPSGWYDRERAAWIPSDNGRIVRILSIDDGMASIDADGSGSAAGTAALAELGFDDDERRVLATLYDAGQSLWRVPVTHFTPWDYNWPFGPPPDAVLPVVSNLEADPIESQPDCERGSVIECQNQVLGKTLPIAGTGITLNYRSDLVSGRRAAYSMKIPLTGASYPASLQRIEVELKVAGQYLKASLAPAPGLFHTMHWDGRDAYGRKLQGAQRAIVRVGYVYNGVYYTPESLPRSFGMTGRQAITGDRNRVEVTLWTESYGKLGAIDATALGLGGWMLSAHHVYDPGAGILYRGDGSRIDDHGLVPTIHTIAGTGVPGFSGDGGPAVDAQFGELFSGIVAGPDGSLYVVDSEPISQYDNRRVRRISPDGIITTVAGGGSETRDGVPAVQARLGQPTDVALGADGSLYIADGWFQGDRRVRRVDPNGIITTVAGTGTQGFSGDGGPATAAQLQGPHSIAIGPDGSLYIADAANQRIRRVTPDGIIDTIAGTGVLGYSEETPALQARLSAPTGMAMASDGSLYFTDNNNIIRVVRPNGRVSRFAGGAAGAQADYIEGVPAIRARLSLLTDVAIAADGAIYFPDRGHNIVRRIGTDGIITTVAGDGSDRIDGRDGPARNIALYQPTGTAVGPDGSLYISDHTGRVRRISERQLGYGSALHVLASADGREVYEFDAAGRHLSTRDTVSGALLHRFIYDAKGMLSEIDDGDGNRVRVLRDAMGVAYAIVAPGGQRTDLAVGASGGLETVTNPAGESYRMIYGNGGLLTGFSDARGQSASYEYDGDGRLVRSIDAAGGGWTLARAVTAQAYEVTVASSPGQSSIYRVEHLPAGDLLRTTMRADGTRETLRFDRDGTQTHVAADGTVTSLREGMDPRFAMNSPVPEQLRIATLGGVASEVLVKREAVLADADDPLSHTRLNETIVQDGIASVASYDAAQRRWTYTRASGRVDTAVLDAGGRIASRRSGSLAGLAWNYDVRGRIVQVTQGDAAERRYRFAYDAQGALASITDPLDRTTSFAYDDAGRLTNQSLSDGRALSFGYDENGNLTSLVAPSGAVQLFQYTPLDQQASHAQFVGEEAEVTRYTYDGDRRLSGMEMPGGDAMGFDYDAGGRLASIAIPLGRYEHGYDEQGRLASLSAPQGAMLSFTWDGFLPTSETWAGEVNGTVSRAFGTGFRLGTLSVAGESIAFSYGPDGMPTRAGALMLRRDANGLASGTTLDRINTVRSHDGFGEPASETASFDDAPLAHFSYARDALGRITSREETIAGTSVSESYAYDESGRLNAVTRSGVTTHWTYDSNGNRTHRDGVQLAAYDARDRLLHQGGTSYEYDAKGALRSRSDGGGATHYDYDLLGNLRRVELADGTVVEYLVDGRNRRIGKKVNGELMQGLLYQDRLHPVAELAPDGSLKSLFVYGERSNVPDYMVRDGVRYRIVSDHLGSPRLVVNAGDGSIAQRIDYDVWGRVIHDSNPGFQPFGFAGGIRDTHTGLVRFGARDYDPETGRWTNRDPIGFAGGDVNLYSYAMNDPVNFVDPDGQYLIYVAGAVLGGVAGGLIAAATDQPIVAGIVSGAIGGAALGGGLIANAVLGSLSGVTSYFVGLNGCTPTVSGVVKNALLGSIGGVLGREIGLRNGLLVARAGEGGGQVLGKNGSVASAYYAQAVGGAFASGGISAAGN